MKGGVMQQNRWQIMIGVLLVVILVVQSWQIWELRRSSDVDAHWSGRHHSTRTNLDLDDFFSDFNSIQKDMNQMFDQFQNRIKNQSGLGFTWEDLSLSPDADLQEKDGEYIVTVDLPGSDNSNISISTEDQSIRISAEIKQETDSSHGGYLFKERRTGRFERSFSLPTDADSGAMRSTYEDGVLTITIPKK